MSRWQVSLVVWTTFTHVSLWPVVWHLVRKSVSEQVNRSHLNTGRLRNRVRVSDDFANLTRTWFCVWQRRRCGMALPLGQRVMTCGDAHRRRDQSVKTSLVAPRFRDHSYRARSHHLTTNGCAVKNNKKRQRKGDAYKMQLKTQGGEFKAKHDTMKEKENAEMRKY